MDLRRLRAFAEVADSGSFSRAAASLAASRGFDLDVALETHSLAIIAMR